MVNKDILKEIGLSEDEILIYLHLNRSGVQSVKQVSEAININRTTTYRYLESLIQKGLVSWIIEKRGKKVKAEEPFQIQQYLTDKRNRIIQLENSLPDLIAQLQSQKPNPTFETKVKYFEGLDGLKQITWNRLRAHGTVCSYTPFGVIDHAGLKFEEEFAAEWRRRKLKDRVISNELRMDYIKEQITLYSGSLDIKIIPSKKFYITNDIAIYNNVIAILSLEKDNLVGVEIENAEMAKTQKSIFDIVWDAAKSVDEYL